MTACCLEAWKPAGTWVCVLNKRKSNMLIRELYRHWCIIYHGYFSELWSVPDKRLFNLDAIRKANCPQSVASDLRRQREKKILLICSAGKKGKTNKHIFQYVNRVAWTLFHFLLSLSLSESLFQCKWNALYATFRSILK